MIRVMPSFADLMLLPPVIAQSAEVFMKNDRIAVRTDNQADQDQIVHALQPYPHVELHVDQQGDIVMEPLHCHYRRIMFAWPDGRTEGVLLWDGGYYTTVDSSSFQVLTTTGLHVQTLFCRADDTLESVLLRLTS